MSSQATRIEHDLLGEKAVPADAYYGVQTARALENFHISGVELRLYPNVIKAFAMVKLAAARANFDCGQFSAEILKGIEGACQELIDGQAPRRVPPRRLPGRGRHLDQHERERGDREPGPRADGPPEGRVQALQPPRPRQLLAVHERRLPDRAARRDGPRERGARGGHEGADRGLPRQGQGVRLHPEDGAHPAPGRGADDAGAGVRGLRGDARGRGPGAREDPERPVRGQHGGDRDRHGPQRPRGLRGEVHRAPREDHRLPDPPRRRT